MTQQSHLWMAILFTSNIYWNSCVEHESDFAIFRSYVVFYPSSNGHACPCLPWCCHLCVCVKLYEMLCILYMHEVHIYIQILQCIKDALKSKPLISMETATDTEDTKYRIEIHFPYCRYHWLCISALLWTKRLQCCRHKYGLLHILLSLLLKYITQLCSYPLYGFCKCSVNTDICQWAIFSFFFFFALKNSMILVFHGSCCEAAIYNKSKRSYGLFAGKFNFYCHTTNICLTDEIEGITFGMALIRGIYHLLSKTIRMCVNTDSFWKLVFLISYPTASKRNYIQEFLEANWKTSGFLFLEEFLHILNIIISRGINYKCLNVKRCHKSLKMSEIKELTIFSNTVLFFCF